MTPEKLDEPMTLEAALARMTRFINVGRAGWSDPELLAALQITLAAARREAALREGIRPFESVEEFQAWFRDASVHQDRARRAENRVAALREAWHAVGARADAAETREAALREALADARRLAYPFSLSPQQREKIIARIDALLSEVPQ